MLLASNLHSTKAVVTGMVFYLGSHNLVPRIYGKLVKAFSWHGILRKQTGKFTLFAKRVLSRERVVVEERYVKNWKDYYKILRVSPDAEQRTITAAYEKLAYLYHYILSDRAKRNPFFVEMMNDINEANRVLSDPCKRDEYDRLFWARCSPQDKGIENTVTGEIIDLMVLAAHEVSKIKDRMYWMMPRWSKIAQQAVLILFIAILSVMAGGTSFAFAKPEHTAATPFKGVAIVILGSSSAAISLIEDVRGVTVMYEYSIVSEILQLMRVTEGIVEVPPVTVPTNDMACFPSTECPLFPDYLQSRFSQFKYTVDSKGVVSVNTSGATTDALLRKIVLLINRLDDVQ